MLGKCCPFFWSSVSAIWPQILVEVILKVGLVWKCVLLLFLSLSLGSSVFGFVLAYSLGSSSWCCVSRCSLESDELGYWEKKREKIVLVWLSCWWLVVSSCLSVSS